MKYGRDNTLIRAPYRLIFQCLFSETECLSFYLEFIDIR